MAKKIRLAGVHEAALILGISKASLADRRRHSGPTCFQVKPEFPEPLAELMCGPVWDADELRRYRHRYELHALYRYSDPERWRRNGGPLV
jgi:hypothetical protein